MHCFGGPILPKHLVDGQDRSESAKGAERMRRHVGGKDARTLRRIHQSGLVCGILQTKYCNYTCGSTSVGLCNMSPTCCPFGVVATTEGRESWPRPVWALS